MKRMRVLSQFGRDGEYIHDVDDVPDSYGNTVAKFYSDPSSVAEAHRSDLPIEADQRYENRFDTALSAYLMALSDVAEAETILRASQILFAFDAMNGL